MTARMHSLVARQAHCVLWFMLLAACRAVIPDGVYRCVDSKGCPDKFTCDPTRLVCTRFPTSESAQAAQPADAATQTDSSPAASPAARVSAATDANRAANSDIKPNGPAGNTASAGRSGAGAQAHGGGSAGAAVGAGGAGNRDAPGCQGDIECQEPNLTACRVSDATCVECTAPKHCTGTCNTTSFRCVGCTSNSDCESNACDLTNQACVDCKSDANCRSEADMDTCDDKFKCVDCDKGRGCTDPAKPACYGQTCVECDADTDCRTGAKRTCRRSSHTCVECTESTGDCLEAARPVCDIANNTCVGCLVDNDCASKHCVDQQCVECELDDDCKTAGKAECNDNACVKCTSQAACKHLAATPACDTAAGTCVACIDDSTCGQNACLRSMRKCSNVPRGSVVVCGSCEADSQCAGNLKCVAMPDATPASGKRYCLFSRQMAGTCANSATHAYRPYSRSVSGTSVDGVNGPFCAPKHSCEALMDATGASGLPISCSRPDECGLGTVSGDAICNNDLHCTYTCATVADCPKAGLQYCTGNCSSTSS